jgi:hypothetical protein
LGKGPTLKVYGIPGLLDDGAVGGFEDVDPDSGLSPGSGRGKGDPEGQQGEKR